MRFEIDSDEFERWMKQAKHTLRLVEVDLKVGGYDWACFKSQQACEFALKALLRALGRQAFGHNVLSFYREASEICGGSEEIEDCVSYLDKLYITPRYPDAFPEGFPAEHFTKRDALKAKECSEKVIKWVELCLASRP